MNKSLITFLISAALLLNIRSSASETESSKNFRAVPKSSSLSDINQIIQSVLYRLEDLNQKTKYYQENSANDETFSANLLDIHQLFLSLSSSHSSTLQSLQISNVSESCSTQLSHLFKALYAKEFWSFKVIDSFGKPPSGILQGSLNWVGEYVECKNISVESINWQSKHCVISKLNKEKNIDPNNVKISLRYGVCMPKNCSSSDIANVINFLIDLRFSKYGLVINPEDVVCSEEKSLDARAIIAM